MNLGNNPLSFIKDKIIPINNEMKEEIKKVMNGIVLYNFSQIYL